jgi:hypothetical protein
MPRSRPQVLAMVLRIKIDPPYCDVLDTILAFSSFAEAEKTIQHLDYLCRNYQLASDKKGKEMRMPPEPETQSGHDSFVDVLHSEIITESENLTAWVKQVSDQGAIESLFAMESWLKGIRSFFRTEHLPLSAAEKAELARRSFAAEIGVVRQAVQVCEIHACNVMKPGMGGKLEFEEFIEIQMRKDRMPDFSLSRMVEQLTPRDSVAQLLAFLNDLRVTIDAIKDKTGMDYQLFLSLGRFFDRELKNCRYIDMLLSQHLRIQYDLVENKHLSSVLHRISEEAVRRNVAIALLHLFRFLKYLKFVATDLTRDQPLQKHLVIFSQKQSGRPPSAECRRTGRLLTEDGSAESHGSRAYFHVPRNGSGAHLHAYRKRARPATQLLPERHPHINSSCRQGIQCSRPVSVQGREPLCRRKAAPGVVGSAAMADRRVGEQGGT